MGTNGEFTADTKQLRTTAYQTLSNLRNRACDALAGTTTSGAATSSAAPSSEKSCDGNKGDALIGQLQH